MKQRKLIAALLGLSLSAGVAGIAVAGGAGSSAISTGNGGAGPVTDTATLRNMALPNRIKGDYIVVLNDQSEAVSANAIRSASDALTSSYGGKAERFYDTAIKGFSITGLNDYQAKRLSQDPQVAFVEADQTMSISATQSPATWGLDRIDQTDLPLNNAYNYDTTASGVDAYVIDTGIRTSHSNFGGRAVGGFAAINDGRGAEDCNGHGTHVAGTVGSSTYGVAKGVTLIAVRVLGCNGSGSNSGVIDGVDYVAQSASGPTVANMSLGGGASTALDNAIANATNNGVTMVVAAGNENQNACNVSPARAPSAVTVGSTTSSDSRSSFSNYGTCVDIFAPGSSITSTWHTSNSATNTISGTSMASPHVAGAAALILADNPGASPAFVSNTLESNGIANTLSGVGSGSPNLMLYTGGGSAPPPPPPPGGGDLDNGDTLTGLSGSQGAWDRYTFDVPSGATNLSVTISGGSGDADLYVRRGSQPTTSSYDCRPYRNGNNETCSFSSPGSGTWHIGLRGYRAYSGVSLSVSWDEPGGGGGPEPQEYVLNNLSGGQGAWAHYTLAVDPGYGELRVNIAGGSGDADLYVRRGAQPTTSSYDCRPYRNGNNETCTFNNPASDTWYISLRGYRAYSGVTLTVNLDP